MAANESVVSSGGLDEQLSRLLGSDPAAMADPFPLWNRLRNEHPIHVVNDVVLFSSNQAVRKLIDEPRALHNAHGRGKRAVAARARLSADEKIAFDEVSAFEALY